MVWFIIFLQKDAIKRKIKMKGMVYHVRFSRVPSLALLTLCSSRWNGFFVATFACEAVFHRDIIKVGN